MAYADYFHCAVCDGKAFYDANVDWDYAHAVDVVALCKPCSAKYEIRVVNKETGATMQHVMFPGMRCKPETTGDA